MGIVFDREAGGTGGADGDSDGNLDTGMFVLEIGGDGGFVTGGLRIRIAGLAGCGMAASFKQSCDCRMLCALATLVLLVRLSFFGGGDGFCRVADGANLGTMGDFANPLGTTSGLLVIESVTLCPCAKLIILLIYARDIIDTWRKPFE
ncbi:hypothetical protein PUN28_005496 [Cardiocondyla obscurior]|uniref:Uncharacterized protein n=1 Tax=Cardiocondyla obscurior TaxID=286306 RepID=A0AAW2GI34_9HYME